jgi:anti-sigma factor ChrR (cupin superfamily)
MARVPGVLLVVQLPRSLAIDLGALLANGIEWTPLDDGVEICRLYGDGKEGPSAALVRYAPKARLRLHEHDGTEHIFILSGFQEDDAGVYPAGTMVVNPPGSRHSVRAPEGCMALVLWEKPVRFI